jgi:3'-5' exonuclease
MTIMVFDIETIPDVEAGKSIYKIDPNLSTIDVIKVMHSINRQKKNGSEFLPHYLHKIVAISVLIQDRDLIKIWSLGSIDDSEKKLIERFFSGLEMYQPTLVSWNGIAFDLPVIHYRSLLHQVISKTYWEVGESRTEFKWSNYINRYHYKHIDVMDLLSGYQKSASASLDHIAIILGLPGKMVLTADQVLSCYLEGDLQKIRNYCEIDVLNTYIVFLKTQLIRGIYDKPQYTSLCMLLKNQIEKLNLEHLHEFSTKWLIEI